MQLRRAPAAALVVMAALTLTACSGGSQPTATFAPAPPATVSVPAAVATTTAPPTTVQPTTTEAPTTTAAPTTTVEDAVVETRLLGQSVESRPIMAERRGTKGGRVVLIIGVIHGDENAGLAIVDDLQRMDVPADVDLWLVDSMNPDGVANNDRHNGNGVDLNRNFPLNWGPIGVPGDGQYAGPSAASEPETQAMVAFISEIRPDLVLWYHQDLYRISPGRGRDGAIRERYAELTGLPVVSITGGTYTGVAATWARNTLDPGVAFIVELGASLTDAEAELHANAVMTIAADDM